MAGSVKWTRAVTRLLESKGLEVRMGRSGHYKVYRGSELLTTLPATPSDYRGVKNAESFLRRRGVNVKLPKQS